MNGTPMTNVAHWMKDLRGRIDAKLEAYLDAKQAEAKELSPQSIELVEGVASLTLRGGKRFRPIMTAAAFQAVAPEGDVEATISVGASLELLQSFLLIHDDWMDGDLERRGGPAVHAIYRDRYPQHLGDSVGILAGDLASTYALELFLEAPFPDRNAALARFMKIQKEVFFGQHLDITANADVSRMHDLKTGSYTVRGPLLLGALLGDASAAQNEALLAYGNPIGEAFQLADDLLGTFGDEAQTGKPGDDLRHGKRTSLIFEAQRLLGDEEFAFLEKLITTPGPSDADVAAASELLITSGAKANVEARLEKLHQQAIDALADAPFGEDGKELLRFLAGKLAKRNS